VLALEFDSAGIEATETRRAIAAMRARNHMCSRCLPVKGASALLQNFVSTRLNGLASIGR